MVDISTSVVVRKCKYDLEKMTRGNNVEVRSVKVVAKNFIKKNFEINTSLAAPGALGPRLQRRTV